MIYKFSTGVGSTGTSTRTMVGGSDRRNEACDIRREILKGMENHKLKKLRDEMNDIWFSGRGGDLSKDQKEKLEELKKN